MDIILIFKAIILGIVEGITEWLPVSSTGHMILVDEFINLNVSPAFKEMFSIRSCNGCCGALLEKAISIFNKRKVLNKRRNFSNVV